MSTSQIAGFTTGQVGAFSANQLNSAKPVTLSPLTLAGSGTLYGIPAGTQDYQLTTIDASQFTNGGTISITIALGNGASGASYDLFDATTGVTLSSDGRPLLSLANAYDVGPGATTTLSYTFKAGQSTRYLLGIEGNWGSSPSSTNSYSYGVNVTPQNVFYGSVVDTFNPISNKSKIEKSFLLNLKFNISLNICSYFIE